MYATRPLWWHSVSHIINLPPLKGVKSPFMGSPPHFIQARRDGSRICPLQHRRKILSLPARSICRVYPIHTLLLLISSFPLPPSHALFPGRAISPHLQLSNLPLQPQSLRNKCSSLFLQLCYFVRWCSFEALLCDLESSTGQHPLYSREQAGEYTCLTSDFIFNPAPYHVPVTVTAAMAPVKTMRRIFCCVAAADILSISSRSDFDNSISLKPKRKLTTSRSRI
jgi:hypothetical protein